MVPVQGPLERHEELLGLLGAGCGHHHDGGVRRAGSHKEAGARCEAVRVLGEGADEHLPPDAVRLQDLPDEDGFGLGFRALGHV